MKRQFIFPSTLGLVLLCCALAVQALSVRGYSQQMVQGPEGGLEWDWVQLEDAYGIPAFVRVTSVGPSEDEQGPRTLRLEWLVIGVSLAVWWVLVMPVARWITGYRRRDGSYAGPTQTGPRHPAVIVLYVLAGCAAGGTIAAVAFGQSLSLDLSLPEVALIFSLLFAMVCVPATMVVMIVRRWRYRSRLARRGFAVEFPAAAAES